MPKIGELKKGREIGKKPEDSFFIWQACNDCGKERWIYIYKGNPLCPSCARKGANNAHWKNGKAKRLDGYSSILLDSGDFFYPMANPKGRVLEHRLVMARYLGRCLSENEIVHHIDGNRQNNELDNLMLFPSHKAHKEYHHFNKPTVRVSPR